MSLNQQSVENQALSMQELSKRLKASEASVLKTVLDLGLNPDNLTESDGVAIAQLLAGQKPQKLNGQPETEPATSNEIDSLSLVAESDDLDLAADNVAQNVSNGSSIKQGFIDNEIQKTAAQAEMLAHLNTAIFADTYRKTTAENMEQFMEISDKNHEEFMTSIIAKFSELGKGNPSDLPQKMSQKAEQQQQKTQAYTEKIRQNFNPKYWQN